MPAYDLGFRSLDVEREGIDLAIEGEIPKWLSGSLLRNGPGRFEVGGERVDHWFDGLAMIHRFGFADGGVTYTNRFLRSDAYERAVQEGELTGQFATSGSYLERLRSFLDEPTDNANVHVAREGGEYVALTETPRRVRIDPETLETKGHLAYEDDLTGHHATAHLQHDRERGETVGYMTEFGRRNRYHVYRVPDDRPERIPIASIDVDRPAYLHSFGLTPEHVVIVEPPYTVNPVRFLLPGAGGFIDSYRWRPDRGTRCLVVDRDSGELVADRRTDAFFFFHTVNAFESEGAIVVDLVAYDDATIVENLFLGSLESTGDASGGRRSMSAADGTLTRLRIPLEAGEEVRRTPLYRGIELPRTSPRVHMQEYRYAYGQATEREGQNGLVKVDVETEVSWEWWEKACYAGEPVFVAHPDAETDPDGEDRGVLLAPVLDVDAERSVLLVLDGETLRERARAILPHHVPFDFHGEFFPAVEP